MRAMLAAFFHAWERRLADATKDRVVRPFDWGLDWMPANGHRPDAAAADVIGDWVSHVMADTDAFFTPPPTTEYTLTPSPDGDLLTFPSALATPHEANNTVSARYFPARGRDGLQAVRYARNDAVHEIGAGHDLQVVPHRDAIRSRAAVLVLPQWNSDARGHIGLSRLLA